MGFFVLLSLNLVVEVCRWLLHVQLLFLLCNNKKIKTCGGLLICFKKRKKKKMICRCLKTTKQDRLDENFDGKRLQKMSQYNFLFKIDLIQKLYRVSSRHCPGEFWVSSRTEMMISLRNFFQRWSTIKGKYFFLTSNEFLLLHVVPTALSLCPSKTSTLFVLGSHN